MSQQIPTQPMPVAQTPEMLRITQALREKRIGYWQGFGQYIQSNALGVAMGVGALAAVAALAGREVVRRNPPRLPKSSRAVEMVRSGWGANPPAMIAGATLGAAIPAIVAYNKHVYLPSLTDGAEKNTNEIITWGMLAITAPATVNFGITTLGLGYVPAVGLTAALDGTLAFNKSPAGVAAAIFLAGVVGLELGYAMSVGTERSKKPRSLVYRTFVGQH